MRQKSVTKIHSNVLQKFITMCVRYYKMWQKFITKCVRYYKMWQKFIAKCVRYYKVCQVLQSVTDCYYKERQVWHSVTDCYYKVRRVLQSVTVIRKWDLAHGKSSSFGFAIGFYGTKTLELINKIQTNWNDQI